MSVPLLLSGADKGWKCVTISQYFYTRLNNREKIVSFLSNYFNKSLNLMISHSCELSFIQDLINTLMMKMKKKSF